MKCQSSFCTVQGGREIQGGQFCKPCLRLMYQVDYFTSQTAQMIRNKWREYSQTDLPREVKIFMRVFVEEILNEMNHSLTESENR